MSTRLTDEQVRETLAFLRSGSPLHPGTAREMADNLERYCTALEAELKEAREELRQLKRDARDDEQSAATEAYWRERQGEDYGTY